MLPVRLRQGGSLYAVILTGTGFAPSMQARFTTHVLNSFAISRHFRERVVKVGEKGVKTLPLKALTENNLNNPAVLNSTTLTVAPCIRISAQ